MSFNDILFFVKGEVIVFKTLHLEHNGIFFEETIEIERLSGGSVFGESFYLSKENSTVKIMAVNRG